MVVVVGSGGGSVVFGGNGDVYDDGDALSCLHLSLSLLEKFYHRFHLLVCLSICSQDYPLFECKKRGLCICTKTSLKMDLVISNK